MKTKTIDLKALKLNQLSVTDLRSLNGGLNELGVGGSMPPNKRKSSSNNGDGRSNTTAGRNGGIIRAITVGISRYKANQNQWIFG